MKKEQDKDLGHVSLYHPLLFCPPLLIFYIPHLFSSSSLSLSSIIFFFSFVLFVFVFVLCPSVTQIRAFTIALNAF
jgi:hypothetical protein